MSATLHGTLTTYGATPEAVNIVVRFFTPGTDTEIHRSASVSDNNGDFYVYDAPVGTYDVGIKPQAALSKLVASQTFTEGETTDVAFGEVYFGDLDFNDAGTIMDFSIFSGGANGKAGDCAGYAGDWLMPQCPSPPPAGGACYGYVIG